MRTSRSTEKAQLCSPATRSGIQEILNTVTVSKYSDVVSGKKAIIAKMKHSADKIKTNTDR